jgi:ribonuclease P protein subunit POP4
MNPVTPRNILRHELIGLDVDVIRSSNKYCDSISGKVVDESRNTLMIKQGESVKRVAKRDSLFKFKLDEGCVKVEGSALVSRPEDRVKRKSKRRW